MPHTSSKAINITILAGLALLCSGAGYVGELPKLGKPFSSKPKNTSKLNKNTTLTQELGNLSKSSNYSKKSAYSDLGKPAGVIIGEYVDFGNILSIKKSAGSHKPSALLIKEFNKKNIFSDKLKSPNNGKPMGLILGEFDNIDEILKEAKYEKELIKLDKPPKTGSLIQQNYEFGDPVEKELLQIAPKDFPEIYLGTIVGYGKYAGYLKDLKNISPYMLSIRSLAESGPNAKNIQMFSAKANMYNLFVDNMKKKYKNKPEANFESFENIVKLREVLQDTQEYWFNHEKYKKFFHGNISDKEDAMYVLDEKFEEILDLISLTLDTIRDNSLD